MTHPTKVLKNSLGFIAMLFLMAFLSSCNFPLGRGDADQTVQEVVDESLSENKTSAEEEPLVVLDYSQIAAIDDAEDYQNKYLGEIFLIKNWQTVSPESNSLTVFGKIPFTIHPDQPIEAMEFKNPNQPTLLTGYGQGWGMTTIRGEGGGASSVCTAEFKAEFRLVGSFYPAPACAIDVDIVSTYFTDNMTMTCVYDNGMQMTFPVDSWQDVFTDVKLPIGFQIPDRYVTRFTATENNVKYDLSYYLYNFYGRSPSAEELALVLGDTPVQFFNTGCGNVHLEFDAAYLPEGSEVGEVPPSAWEIMLTPASQRELPQ